MSETTIIALVIIGGVFVVMSITILKAGIDAAIKLWSVMGALTGIAFGSITTFYFADRSHQQEIRQVQGNKEAVERVLDTTLKQVENSSKQLSQYASGLESEQHAALARSVTGRRSATPLPQSSDTLAVEILQQASKQLEEVSAVGAKALGVERTK